ncbi:MAG: hypothetical protein ACREDH_14870, partial [Methylocella sp.]
PTAARIGRWSGSEVLPWRRCSPNRITRIRWLCRRRIRMDHKDGSAQGYNGQQSDEKLLHDASVKKRTSASGTTGLHALFSDANGRSATPGQGVR